MKRLIISLSFFCAVNLLWSQDAQPDRVTVPFSDPARPKTLKASLINGSITVKGYDGKDAIVEARPESGGGKHRRDRDNAEGMRRIDINSTGLVVEESDNVITVGTRSVNENISV